MRKIPEKTLKQMEEFAERMRKAGKEPPPIPTEMPLIVISTITTVQAGLDKGQLSKDFQDEIDARLTGIEFTSPLSGVLLRPIIMDPVVATPFKDFATHQRDGGVHVGLNIDHTRWIEASWAEKIDIFAENICASIGRIKEKRLSSAERAKLLDAVEQSRQALQRKSLN